MTRTLIGPGSWRGLGLGVGLAIVAALTSLTGPVRASANYPEVVQQVAESPCAPPCTTCHRDTSGGMGTAVKPFAVSLRAAGLVANDDAALRRALKELAADEVDSDEDGMSDLDELAAGRDPSVPGDAAICLVTYGCGARVAPPRRAAQGAWPLVGAALVVAGFHVVRRRAGGRRKR